MWFCSILPFPGQSCVTPPACNIISGQYKYMDDLLALEATVTGLGPAPFRPATPPKVAAWSTYLRSHPDGRFTNNGFTHGFHIGADHKAVQFRASGCNLQSVWKNPQLVEQHIQEEVWSFRLLGPVPPFLATTCHTSPIGLIPKPNQPGQWRLIVDLSAPAGAIVNDATVSTLNCAPFAMLPWMMRLKWCKNLAGVLY